ncbi:Gp19/Gp15/Gp42 family protein [Rhodococcus gordoniae]|uniref:Gp19/Gp15/Gp42 family protein n=1 Tax=Rhodococcus gordoniae TaxID=223392 RepID=UPI0020CD3A7B|nr:Gp19/Gp15/Gp42 family protein [Rhodococcus gordoniae]UTT48925.1 phage Gp19/Gp15/Gp42 family protein [Rhodococcus gordoniae]
MAHATAEDVQALLGRKLTPEETVMVERRLVQVERMIVRRIPDLSDRITSGDIDQADVVDIEAEAVLRVVRNPEGLLLENDGSYGYQFDRNTASGRLEILPEEWQALGIRPSKMHSLVPNLVAPVRRTAFGNGG